MTLDIINTGGTFNKRYDPIEGALTIDSTGDCIKKAMAHCYKNHTYTLHTIIQKDSLDFTDTDRDALFATIESCGDNVLIIHGTDTMKKSCRHVAQKLGNISQKIVFTGSMYPCYMQNDEAVFNFSSALGALNCLQNSGIFIAMHGLVLPFEAIEKDYVNGKFFASKD